MTIQWERARVIEASGQRTTWSYDPTYQLVREQWRGFVDVTYVYDPVGNRTLRDSVAFGRATYTHDAANQVTDLVGGDFGDSQFNYDGAGNLARATLGPITMTWDGDNRLVDWHGAGLAGPRSTYTYDGDGRRVRIQFPTSTVKYVWDGENILTETNGSDVTQAVFTMEPLQYGQVVSHRRGAATRFYLFNALGSTDRLLDAAQAVTNTFNFQAFGETNTTLGNVADVTLPFRWLGQFGYFRDARLFAELSVRSRFYSPTLGGRWLSKDPLGLDGGMDSNLYNYAINNPTNISDPSGLSVFRIATCTVLRSYVDPSTCVTLCDFSCRCPSGYSPGFTPLSYYGRPCEHPPTIHCVKRPKISIPIPLIPVCVTCCLWFPRLCGMRDDIA
ncbi:MAG: hypothetical protein KF708_19980 [Pirellulales bacterium]|nr:hypothetical protein [Pirellulales bacterium]